MSKFDYATAQQLQGVPFTALLMAAMLRADRANGAVLKMAFPEVADEVMRRYHAPAGVLPEDSAS